MKIHIELSEHQEETEITIVCARITPEIEHLQKLILSEMKSDTKFLFYQGSKEYYLKLCDILFFETSENGVCAHTKSEVYQVKRKLYELEEVLPKNFLRISKSTIINMDSILSIDRNLTSYSLISFYQSHKQVYVSRLYYKLLKEKLEKERSL